MPISPKKSPFGGDVASSKVDLQRDSGKTGRKLADGQGPAHDDYGMAQLPRLHVDPVGFFATLNH
jgi:hypothetical protein